MMDMNRNEKALMTWRGVGLWNVYFIAKFALAALGYLNLNLLYNALLLIGLALPIRMRALQVLRAIVGLAFGVTLLYSESWLPSVDSIMANAGNIADFSLLYIAQTVFESINWTMVAVGVLLFFVYLFVKDWLRVTALTSCYLVWLFVQPYWTDITSDFVPQTAPSQSAQATPSDSLKGVPQFGTTDTANLNRWLESFYSHEATRKTAFPSSVGTKPFDVLLVNVCSLSNDDLSVLKLTDHPVLKRFDVYFDAFNSATAYSGPATIRLLSASCGQASHSTLYNQRRPECELMTQLKAIGYDERLYMDHEGKFDDYLGSLKTRVGMEADLASQKGYRVRYTGFDGEAIFDDADVFADWLKGTEAGEKPNATLMNLIALHDGNRQRGANRAMPFAPRADLLLDQLQGFMDAIERSGRRVMMVVVPEHGAAVRGDRIQMARLRDIPSPHITQVPVMVKYFGLNQSVSPVHVKDDASYLALSELIARSIDTDVYAKADPTEVIRGLTRGLPQTHIVSENANAAVIQFQDRYFVRLNGGEWLPYQQ